MARKRHLHQPQGVYLGFCQSIQPRAMSAENNFFTTTQTTGNVVVKKTKLGGTLFFLVLFAHLRENV